MKKFLTVITAIVCIGFLPSLIYGIVRVHYNNTRRTHVTATEAAAEEVILPGVYVGPVDIGGLTAGEAEEKVREYTKELNNEEVAVEFQNHTVRFPVGSAKIEWDNPEVIDEALRIGKKGNIIERFKEIHDTERDTLVLPYKRSADRTAVSEFIAETAAVYDAEARNAGMTMLEDGSFTYQEPRDGLEIEQAVSTGMLHDYIVHKWDGTEEPKLGILSHFVLAKGDVEELKQIRDVLGAADTSFTNATYARTLNVVNGTSKINGVVIEPGDIFSVEDALVPFTSENGYYAAAAYIGGKVQDDIGGGICQVSSTLYVAALQAELEIVERHSHSLRVAYVPPSMDATIAERQKDFIIRNNTGHPIYIDAQATEEERQVHVRIFGIESRDPNREVTYESEVTAIIPGGVSYVPAPDQPIGYLQATAYESDGMIARLWKIVKVNGEEVERTKVNDSTYFAQDETYEVGCASSYPGASEAMYNAIATGDLSTIYQTMAIYGGV